MPTPQDVQASLYFIAKDPLYRKEKPYVLKYASETTTVSNYITKRVDDIPIKDLRDIEHNFTFKQNGFAVLKIDSTMAYEEFQDEQRILEVYFSEVANALLEYTHGVSVHLFDFLAGSKNPPFVADGESRRFFYRSTRYSDPYCSPKAAVNMANMFQDQNLDGMSDGHYRKWVYINAWKPLRGPIHDWPLAICDAESVDKGDLLPADVVSLEQAIENMVVHYNPKQRWYYLSNQEPSELLIFRQADSEGRTGLPHTAFSNTAEAPANSVLRESIEVRGLVFLD